MLLEPSTTKSSPLPPTGSPFGEATEWRDHTPLYITAAVLLGVFVIVSITGLIVPMVKYYRHRDDPVYSSARNSSAESSGSEVPGPTLAVRMFYA